MASGKVMILLAVTAEVKTRVVAVVAEDEAKENFLLESVPSAKKDDPLVRVLLVRVSVVARAIRVSVDVGRVRVPVLMMVEMMGVVRVAEVIVGDADMTKVEPVPVCELTEVVFPTEVMGPMRLALVVTLLAVPVRLAVMVPAEKLPLESRTTMAPAVLRLV